MPPPSTRRRSTSRIGLANQLRDAIEASGRSDYALATAAGLAPSVVSRFVAGTRGLTLDSMDALCGVLELHLAVVGGRRGGRTQRRPVDRSNGASGGPPAPREDADGPGIDG